jgi:5'-methylthioadenosine phosphorylase
MYEKLGGEVVGMTGVPEVVLARELNMHYAAVAYSINWASGMEEEMTFVSGDMQDLREKLSSLLLRTLQELTVLDCNCEKAVMFMHPPEE